MKRFRFNPNNLHIPRRNYDLSKYANYIDFLNGKERDCECCCHCFAVFDEAKINLIAAYLAEHSEHECYSEPIFEDQLSDEDENNSTN